MKILFDQGTPVPLAAILVGHEVKTAYELGWARLKNGELLSAAEGKFDLLITTDRNIRYQQNLTGRSLAVLVLPTTSWPRLQAMLPEDIVLAIDRMTPGEYAELPLD
jgi:hypothetical protein